MKEFIAKDGQYDSHVWPGGYPVYYLCADGGILCPACANENKAVIAQATTNSQEDRQWQIVSQNVNWEDADLACDNCYKFIESAYKND